MRKLMLLAAMLAMILVAAAPVLAQDTQDLDADQCQVILGDLTGGAGGVAIADASGGDGGVGIIDQDQSATIDQQYGGAGGNAAAIVQSQEATQDASGGAGGTATADASGGDVSVTVIQRCEQIIEQTIVNRTDTGDANGDGDVVADQDANIVQQYGGDVVVSGSGGDVVIGGGGIDTVGTTVFKGAAVPVFVDKAGAHFIVAKDEPVVIEKGAVTFFKTADVTNVQYQKKATNVQYQYKAGVVQYQDAAPVKKTTLTVLPDTGGASLITLGAGALLVAGGLLARRIVR